MIKASKGRCARKMQFGNSGSFERLSNHDPPPVPAEFRDHHRVNITGRRGDVLRDGEGESYQMDGVLVTHKMVWAEHKQDSNIV